MLLRTIIEATRKPLSIIVTPEDGGETRQFRVSRNQARSAVLGGLLAAGLGIVAVLQFALGVGPVVNARRVAAENDSLRTEFDRLSGIQQSLAEMEEMQQRLRALAGIDAVSTRTTTSPAGSPEVPDVHQLWTATLPTGLPRKGPLSRGYVPGGHNGVDVAGAVGSSIVAAGGGVVSAAHVDSVFGNMIVVDHGQGYETWYGHNAELLVAKGDSVRIGQEIAKLGNTGRSSAPHLHFEVRKDGVPVDPGQYIREYR